MRRFASIASGLFACVTGCGDDGVHHLADAPPAPDDAIDAPAMGTANITANVRCCTVAPGTPQAGVKIFVLHADHSLGATATTDAQGKAAVAVQTGDSVHAIYPEDVDNNTDIATVVGVKPGDNLTFGENYYTLPTAGTSGQINVSWPAVTGVDHYYIYTPCGGWYAGTSTSTTIQVYDYCQTATAPIVFVAFGPNERVLASSYLPSAPFTPGTIPAITWTPLAAPNYALSISGLDAAISQVRFRANAVYRKISFSMTDYPEITAGAASTTLSAPASATRMTATLELNRNGTDGRQTYLKSQASPVTFTAPMPWINGIAVSPGEGKVLWLQTAGTYDATTIYFNWSRYDGKQSHYFNWNLLVPPGTTMLDLGAPPAALADVLPSSTDNIGTDLTLIDLANAASYDEVRALPESTVMNPYGAIEAGTITSVGMSGYDGGEGFSFTARH